MTKLKTNASAKSTDRYNKAIASLEEAAFALVEMTVSEDRGHAESSAFTLLNMGEVGLSAMEFVFEQKRDFRLRSRIVDLLRGASLTHGSAVPPILGRLAESEDLDPRLRAIARSSFAEALARTAQWESPRAAGGPNSSGTSAETSADPGK
jgi:hypothetical protein